MSVMRTSNPAFAGDIFADWARAERRSQVMTVEGTAMKSLLLLVILTATASFAWAQVGRGTLTIGMLLGSAIIGGILALVTIFKASWAPITAPIYAAFQGLFLGTVSNVFNRLYPGIATQAVALTFGVMFIMLFIYAARIIRVTGPLAAAVSAGVGAVALLYLVSLLMSVTGFGTIPLIYSSKPIGIVFSLVVVGLAAFCLLLDFDSIERGARMEAPKFMEWYGAFGLMLTLIWMYREILFLLMKLQDRR